MIIIIGIIIGFLRNNPIREIFACVFPLVEFIAFFYLTRVIIKCKEDITNVQKLALCIILLNVLFALINYINYGPHYYFKFDIDGVILPRLNDFMMPIFVPILFTYYLYIQGTPYRHIVFISLILSILVTMLGGFRSVWIAILVSTAYTTVILKDTRRHVLVSLLFPIITVVILIVFASHIIPAFSPSYNINIFDIVLNRMSIDEMYVGSSVSGRLLTYKSILYNSFLFPYIFIGHGFGSSFNMLMPYDNIYGNLPITSSPSALLNLLYEIGLIATIYICIVGYSMIKRLKLLKVRYDNVYQHIFHISISSAIISEIIVMNIFPAFLHFPIGALFGIAFGIIVKSNTHIENQT